MEDRENKFELYEEAGFKLFVFIFKKEDREMDLHKLVSKEGLEIKKEQPGHRPLPEKRHIFLQFKIKDMRNDSWEGQKETVHHEEKSAVTIFEAINKISNQFFILKCDRLQIDRELNIVDDLRELTDTLIGDNAPTGDDASEASVLERGSGGVLPLGDMTDKPDQTDIITKGFIEKIEKNPLVIKT